MRRNSVHKQWAAVRNYHLFSWTNDNRLYAQWIKCSRPTQCVEILYINNEQQCGIIIYFPELMLVVVAASVDRRVLMGVLLDRKPLLTPNQHCQSTEGNSEDWTQTMKTWKNHPLAAYFPHSSNVLLRRLSDANAKIETCQSKKQCRLGLRLA